MGAHPAVWQQMTTARGQPPANLHLLPSKQLRRRWPGVTNQALRRDRKPPLAARAGGEILTSDNAAARGVFTAAARKLAVGAIAWVGSASALLCFGPQPAAEASIAPPAQLLGPARVVDGDTLEVAGVKVRLFGLDAPEKAQSCADAAGKAYDCGKDAMQALQAKLKQAPVTCTSLNQDQYGRAVATCSVRGGGVFGGEEDIGSWLVSNGYAVAYREFSSMYVPDQAEAAQARRGIWQGTFQEPKEWRKQAKSGSGAASLAPAAQVMSAVAPPKPAAMTPSSEHRPGCDIKGNISASGERIYHVQQGRYYESTQIDTAKGEKWFCSESEAAKEGWRASRQ
mmetsp:Transcript_37035/g.96077  ORF Transcript_37035/g.96077 Transcript_37035/m.96077 type:complete len:340 (-) Transcript_37035:777-1796(-)